MNNREFTRVRSHMPVDIEADGNTISGVARDISFEGLWLPTSAPLPTQTPCRVTIHLAETIKVRAEAMVVRSEPDGIAVHFSELLDLDSYGHLRNLILYNSSDPDTAEQEIARHLRFTKTDPSLSPPE